MKNLFKVKFRLTKANKKERFFTNGKLQDDVEMTYNTSEVEEKYRYLFFGHIQNNSACAGYRTIEFDSVDDEMLLKEWHGKIELWKEKEAKEKAESEAKKLAEKKKKEAEKLQKAKLEEAKIILADEIQKYKDEITDLKKENKKLEEQIPIAMIKKVGKLSYIDIENDLDGSYTRVITDTEKENLYIFRSRKINPVDIPFEEELLNQASFGSCIRLKDIQKLLDSTINHFTKKN